MFKRLIPLIILIAIAALVYGAGLHRLISLEALRDNQVAWRAAADAHPVLVAAGFTALATIIVAASVPLGLPLTALGGFVLGPWTATVGTVIGATLGACGSYLAVHTAFAPALRRRAERSGGLSNRIVAGIRDHTFSTVLTLRLLPLFPFWLTNVAAALIGARLRPFILATAIGVIPESLIYSHIGAGLSRVLARGATPKLSDLADPSLAWAIGALAALSLASGLASVFIRGRSTTLHYPLPDDKAGGQGLGEG